MPPPPTYVLLHNPYIKNCAKIRENPAQEIAKTIGRDKPGFNAFGGWNLTTNMNKIKPEARLLFYRSGVKSHGFFAVGKALPADHKKCRDMRKKKLRCWYPEKPDAAYELKDVIASERVAYKALGWRTGKGETYHINAEWHVVADPGIEDNPEKLPVLLPCNINEIGIGAGPKRNGRHIPDQFADDICAKCMNAAHALKMK